MKTIATAAFVLLFFQPVVAAQNIQLLSLVSQNMNRLFDDRDDGNNEKVLSTQKYRRRIAGLADKIARDWQQPDVIALQEVENQRILKDISDLVSHDSGIRYQALLVEGNDVSGIDVGFLVKQGNRIIRSQALFHDTVWRNGQSTLFSRPPLRIDVCRQVCITIVNLHLRSMRGIHAGQRAGYVRQKRLRQAQTLAHWVDRFQQQAPHKRLILVGDFNALNPSDRYVDVLGTILGQPNQRRPAIKSRDMVKRDLIDASATLAPSQRVSYRFHRHNQQLDYLLINQPLKNRIHRIGFSKIDYRFSDHAALMASISLR